MTAPAKITRIERLRARDGDRCWLCQGMLDFEAVPNSKKAPTIEHLEARANGGTDAIENLALCHPGCNKHLANKPKDEKLRIRAKWAASRQRTAAARTVNAATSREDGGTRRNPNPLTNANLRTRDAGLRARLRQWQLAAIAASAVALLAVGFCAGTLLSG
jgi:hypothetical protein